VEDASEVKADTEKKSDEGDRVDWDSAMDNEHRDEIGLIDLGSDDAEVHNIPGNNGSVSHSERQ